MTSIAYSAAIAANNIIGTFITCFKLTLGTYKNTGMHKVQAKARFSS